MSRSEQHYDLIVIGGGAAGFFGAITAAEFGTSKDSHFGKRSGNPHQGKNLRRRPVQRDTPMFRSQRLGQKLPPGDIATLLDPFHRWQPADTITWFEDHGVDT